ncbi:MAG TPA: MMPL family transporter [Solirubrobacteraceae bacterium]|nr:MMPL family transporter [Solirubrobacteraceae bacterium]
MRSNLAARAGAWSARHRRTAIVGWLLFVTLAFMVGGAIGQRQLTQTEMGNGESQHAARTFDAADFPEYSAEQILIQGDGRLPGDGAMRAAIGDVTRRLAAVPHVFDVQSPLVKSNHGQISRDRHSALVTFKLAGDYEQAKGRVNATLAATKDAQRANPSVRVEQFGDASADKAVTELLADDFRKAEVTSIPITLVILLLAFGALVAAGVPLLLGVTAVGGAIGLLGPVSHLIPVSDMVGSVVLLIGLAVGVDYSLFYLRRQLEERDRGAGPSEALQTAAATSGRAVLISGMTVIVAMAGMLLAGNAVFTSFGLGTILVVAVAMLGSVTVLPAVLSWLGDRVEWGRVPIVARRRHRGDSRLWAAVLDRVLARPAPWLVAGVCLLGALAVPGLGLNTVNPGVAGLPRSLEIMHTYDRMQAAFPGGPMPAQVVVHASDTSAPAVRRGIEDMLGRARDAGLTGPAQTLTSPDRTVTLVTIPLPGDGTDQASEAAVTELRDRVIPATIGRVSGAEASVAGITAESHDFNAVMNARLPYVVGFVLAVAFGLLLVTFRTVVVPAVAIALNLLSVGAAYGVIKLIFQDGNLESLLGFTAHGGVAPWLPLFLFVILFGLSMDYNVFILSRIREGVARGLPTERAVADAIKSTAGVVTSAAAVMVAVFSIFAMLGMIQFKQLGVGLAVAILVDATLVRGVLLPAAMSLLGDRNWYLPAWLDRSLPGSTWTEPAEPALPEPALPEPDAAEPPREPVGAGR